MKSGLVLAVCIVAVSGCGSDGGSTASPGNSDESAAVADTAGTSDGSADSADAGSGDTTPADSGDHVATFGSGDGFSVLGALAQVPASVAGEDDRVELYTADLVAASEANGLSRPAGSTDATELVDWLRPMTESSPVYVQLPYAFVSGSGIVQAQEYVDEVGFGVGDVEAFINWAGAPLDGVVWAGDLEIAATDEVADGVLTFGEGDDFAVDPANRTVARPFGAPLRVAAADGLVVTTNSTTVASEWVDASAPRLDGDPSLAAVATALDGHDVLSAAVFKNSFASESDDVDRGAIISRPFDVVGIGWGISGGASAITVAYSFADPATAGAAAPEVELAFQIDDEGASQSMSEIVTVEDVTVDGAVVVVTLTLPPESPGPRRLLDMMFRGDVPFIHS